MSILPVSQIFHPHFLSLRKITFSVFLDPGDLYKAFFEVVESDLLEAHRDADYEDAEGWHYLGRWDWLCEDEDVGGHRVDDVHEADQRDETCIAALEGNSLAHHTHGVKSRRCKQKHVVKGGEVQEV